MRDRLVALGMRRPTRVKDEDYDVPMLTEDDFEIGILPMSNSIIPSSDHLVRDVEAQKQLAQMCIAKAKLSVCVSHVLTAQYSVLVKHQGMQSREGTTRSSVMLFPKKIDQTEEVKRCDEELTEWINELPQALMYSDEKSSGNSGSSLFVQRSLLHMVYFTTLSALHRPQVLPSGPEKPEEAAHPDAAKEVQDLSRKRVCEASKEITRIAQDLHSRGLEKYLPTTGVTVLLPAIIIHLLNIKSSNDTARQEAMAGFCKCMVVLEVLRDNYASADFAVSFLDAAIKKADIEVVISSSRDRIRHEDVQANPGSQKVRDLLRKSRTTNRQTPPPSDEEPADFDLFGTAAKSIRPENDMTMHTPPDSDGTCSAEQEKPGFDLPVAADLYPSNELDITDFFDYPDPTEAWGGSLAEGAHGENGGFWSEMTWVNEQSGSRLPSPDPGDMFDLDKSIEIGLDK